MGLSRIISVEKIPAIGHQRRQKIYVAIAIVAVVAGIPALVYVSGADERATKVRVSAGQAANRQQLQAAENDLSKGNLSDAEQFNLYSNAALLAAEQNQPEAAEYAKKALELKAKVMGNNVIGDPLTPQLEAIAAGNYNDSSP